MKGTPITIIVARKGKGKRLPRKEKKRIKRDGRFILKSILEQQTKPKDTLSIHDINRKFERFLGRSTSGFDDNLGYRSGAC